MESDLKTVQGVVKELLSQLGGELPVASWRFPEKLASALDPQTVLKERDREDEGLMGDHKVLMLELLVDRLMFLLQCCVRLSETSQGLKVTSLPLTLGSTVRRFWRRVQQDQSTLRQTKEQLSVKDHHISSLEATLSDIRSNTTQDPTSTNSDNSKTLNDTSPSESHLQSKDTPTSNVSTQTTETGFALCVRCADTHRALVELAECVGQVTNSHSLQSSLSSTDWAGLAVMGGLDMGSWSECFRRDMVCISEYAAGLEGRVKELSCRIEKGKEVAVRMEGEVEALTEQVKSLQTTIAEVQHSGEQSLQQTRSELGDQLREMRETCSQLETTNITVHQQLTSSRQQEATLQARIVEIEHKRADIVRDLRTVQSREMSLLSAKQSLERELEVAVDEGSKVRGQLEESRLELAKTKIASQTMNRKNKALVSKQSTLLSRLDELDQECSVLKGQLWELERDRASLTEELASIHTHCEQLKGELDMEKDKLCQSLTEGHALRLACSELQTQVQETKDRLSEEAHRCRLLMDYPFVRQSSADYLQHITSLSPTDSQRQVSANTVRILLLEEQNTELRERGLKVVRERRAHSVQLHGPVRTWRDGLLTQVHSEQATARQVSNEQVNERVRPHSALKGRLGHLVTAIADHRTSIVDT